MSSSISGGGGGDGEMVIPARPRIEVFVNKGGGVTIRTEDAAHESLVAIPREDVGRVAGWLARLDEAIRLGEYDGPDAPEADGAGDDAEPAAEGP